MPARPPSSPLHPVRCEGDDAPIWFAATGNGKTMPLDARATDDGNVAAYCDDRGTWHARVLKAGQDPAPHEKRYHTHFETCDHPEAFRRRQRARITAPAREAPAVVQDSLFSPEGAQ